MLGSADSQKFGYQTRNCICSDTHDTVSSDPQLRVVHDVDVTIDVVVKSNEAIEIPFPRLCAIYSRRTHFVVELHFLSHGPLAEKRMKNDEAQKEKKEKKTEPPPELTQPIVRHACPAFNARNVVK